MSINRPFRFGVEAGPIGSRDDWVASARRAEDLGYSAINLGMHVALGGGGPFAAAGNRMHELELHILCHSVFVVDDPMRGAQMAADRLASFPETAVVHADMSVEELMASPHVLVGSVDHIADTLRERRERYGISYVSVMAPFLDSFAPVVARLAGT